jgi:hypothetical protein
MATMVSCGTTNSGSLYDPNAPVTAIDISTAGTIDPSSRTMALPAGEDDLLAALRKALSNDGWIISTSTTNTRYMMNLQTQVWTSDQKISTISLSIVDQKTGAQVLTGVRKTYSPADNPIDLNAVADMVASSLRKITSP